jgi:hypothetical protein
MQVFALDVRFADDTWKDDANRDRIEPIVVDLGDPSAIKAVFERLGERL